jgi:acyl CoA:acetate/3-ketoacid CoA transferase alpha subunit
VDGRRLPNPRDQAAGGEIVELELERLRLRAGLGDALANAGRGPDAARVFLEAAAAADVTVAEVSEVVPAGSLDPETIVTPGIYVHRLVVSKAS